MKTPIMCEACGDVLELGSRDRRQTRTTRKAHYCLTWAMELFEGVCDNPGPLANGTGGGTRVIKDTATQS